MALFKPLSNTKKTDEILKNQDLLEAISTHASM